MRKTSIIAVGALALAGCATVPALPVAPEGSSGWLAIGDTADMGPKITPLAVSEDSRCPADLQCIHEGRVVVQTRISLAGGTRVTEIPIETGKSIPVADGVITLVAVLPTKTAEATAPADYRFAYRFDGGL